MDTILPNNIPLFGGIEKITQRFNNYYYNSVPLGNCVQLNAMSAGFLSFKCGLRYRFRYGGGHVIVEVKIGKHWCIVETYAGRNLVKNNSSIPIYTDSQPPQKEA
ncbi:MAG: hypothetical protein CL885_02785 [Dehalococcoidia bacterium]|nr:hypothetical protein [Dehalococcoidia bacterium]